MTERSGPRPSGLAPNFNLRAIVAENQPPEELTLPDAAEAARKVMAPIEKHTATLEYELRHDDLTGLLNRRGFLEKAQEAINRGKPFAVFFLDFTNFKKANDRYGHEAGNALLVRFAEKLKKNIRSDSPIETIAHEHFVEPPDDPPTDKSPQTGHIGRDGGDEFKIIIDFSPPPRGDRTYTDEEKLLAVTRHIEELTAEFVAENIHIEGFNVAVGGALWEPGQTLEDALVRADQDMYRHKAGQH